MDEITVMALPLPTWYKALIVETSKRAKAINGVRFGYRYVGYMLGSKITDGEIGEAKWQRELDISDGRNKGFSNYMEPIPSNKRRIFILGLIEGISGSDFGDLGDPGA